jgi:hypothetical protein
MDDMFPRDLVLVLLSFLILIAKLKENEKMLKIDPTDMMDPDTSAMHNAENDTT